MLRLSRWPPCHSAPEARARSRGRPCALPTIAYQQRKTSGREAPRWLLPWAQAHAAVRSVLLPEDCKDADARGVPTRAIETCDQALLYWLSGGREHNGDVRGRSLGCEMSTASRHDHCDLTTDKIASQFG